MHNDYDESHSDLSDVEDDDLFSRHVIQEDHGLLAIDDLLRNVFSQTGDDV